LIKAKEKFIDTRKKNGDVSEFNLEEEITYNGKKLSEVELNFTLPGHSEIELKFGGEDTLVDIFNVDEYVCLIYEQLFRRGLKDIVESFRNGFNMVFPVKNLKTFLSSELEEILCASSNENWDYDTLYENINPNHGYYKNR
jgi:E3 ubiquitin-protein ligase TRIP12